MVHEDSLLSRKFIQYLNHFIILKKNNPEGFKLNSSRPNYFHKSTDKSFNFSLESNLILDKYSSSGLIGEILSNSCAPTGTRTWSVVTFKNQQLFIGNFKNFKIKVKDSNRIRQKNIPFPTNQLANPSISL